MADIEKLVADRIGKLKAAVNEGEAAVSREFQTAAQVNEALRARIAVLDTQLKEAEKVVRQKDSDKRETEKALTGRIRDLQSEIKEKDEALKKQETEITSLMTPTEILTKRATELEAMNEQAKKDVTEQTQRAEDVAQTSHLKVIALQTQVTRTEEMVRKKESAIKGIEEEFTEKIQELESQLRNKDKLLVGRVKQVNDLTSQLHALQDGVRRMSSFFRSTEFLPQTDTEIIGAVLPVTQPQTEEEPAPPEVHTAAMPMDKTDDAVPETISAELFGRITDELTDILGPMAPTIIRHDIMALGESMDNFPKRRLPELLDSITKEISDEIPRTAFLKWFGS